MPKAISPKIVKQIVASVLDDKMSPAVVAEKFGVSLPTVYVKLHECGVRSAEWKHTHIRKGRFPSPEHFADFVATFKTFHEEYRVKQEMPLLECIDIWNNEINTKGNYPPINSLATYHSWKVNHLDKAVPYHKRKRVVEPESDTHQDIATLSVFLGISKHEVVAKAVAALRANLLKAADSL